MEILQPEIEASLVSERNRSGLRTQLHRGGLTGDWFDIHPTRLTGSPNLQFAGGISRETFDTMSYRLLQLFQHPSYLTIDGAPYFSIYELFRFVEGMAKHVRPPLRWTASAPKREQLVCPEFT